jgi:hypothetical protein
MTCIPVSVQILCPMPWYPFVVGGWRRLHLVVHDGVFEGETKLLSSLLEVGEVLFTVFSLAAIFVYNVI